MKHACLLLVGLVCLLCTAHGDDATIGNPPWHLVDYWWDFGQDIEFESYSLDVDISTEIDPNVRLYIASVGIGSLNKVNFYGGIQTQSDGKKDPARPRLQGIGKGGIFSRWGERSVDAVRRGYGGYYESSGHEGDFVSVRNTFEWGKGRYTYSIRKQDVELVDGKPHTWVGAFVRSHVTGEERYVGALRFEGAPLTLGARLASFIEIYGRRIPFDQIPKVSVTFRNWRINGKRVTPNSATAYYPMNVPSYLSSATTGNTVVATVGQPVNRTQDKGLSKVRGHHVQRLTVNPGPLQ